MKLPETSVKRISYILGILEYLQSKNVKRVSSSTIGKYLGTSNYIVRKDISYLSSKLSKKHPDKKYFIGEPGAGYPVERLKQSIREALGLMKNKRICIVGLGKLGFAMLNYPGFTEKGFEIVAGFEKNVNKIETIKTAISIYPSHMIEEIVREKEIEIAIIAVPENEAEDIKKSLIRGGIKGILNLSSPALTCWDEGIVIHNLDIVANLRLIAAILKERSKEYLDEQKEIK